MKNFKKTEKAEGETAKMKAAERKAGYAKMEAMESKMHGKMRGARKTNYKGRAC